MNEQNAQVVVSLAIIAALGVIGVGLICAGVVLKDTGPVWGGIGTVIGALATALNTPSGIAAALTAATRPKSPDPQT